MVLPRLWELKMILPNGFAKAVEKSDNYRLALKLRKLYAESCNFKQTGKLIMRVEQKYDQRRYH